MEQVKEKEDLPGKNLPPIVGELHIKIDLAELFGNFPPVIVATKEENK